MDFPKRFNTPETTKVFDFVTLVRATPNHTATAATDHHCIINARELSLSEMENCLCRAGLTPKSCWLLDGKFSLTANL